MSSLRRLFPGLFTDLQRPTFGTQRLERDQTDIGPLLRGLNNALYQSGTLPNDINALLGAAASPEGRQALSQGLLTTGGDFLTALGELTREGNVFKHLGRPDLLSSLADAAADNPPDVTDLLPGGPALGMVGTAGRGALLKRLAKAQATPGKEATQFFTQQADLLKPQTTAEINKRVAPLRRELAKMEQQMDKKRQRLLRMPVNRPHERAAQQQAKAEFEALVDAHMDKLDEIKRAGGEHASGISANVDKQFDTIQSLVQSLPGLPPEELARLDRAVQQGFTVPGFHATKGDITAFDPGLLGTTTQANSARLGFFFAADKQTPQSYFKYATGVQRDRVRPEALEDLKQRFVPVREQQEVVDDLANRLRSGFEGAKTRLSRSESGLMSDLISEPVRHSLLDLASLAENAAKGHYPRESALKNQAMAQLKKEKTRQLAEAFYQEQIDLQEKLLKERVRQDDLEARYYQHKEQVDADEAFGSVMPVFLKMDNPKVIEFNGGTYRDISYSKSLKEARNQGHDSAIFRNTMDGGPVTDVYIVFDPGQIRSTQAAFDPAQAPTTRQGQQLRGRSRRFYELDRQVGQIKTSVERKRDEIRHREAQGWASNKIVLPDMKDKLKQEEARLAEAIKARDTLRETEFQTSDVLASGAPILYPLGMGAAAEAYLANQEDR